MYALIKKKTNSGRNKYIKVNNIENAIFFDDVKARIQVDEDCCVRTPVRPKDIEKYNELE